jgi:hypothetical protein
VIQTYAIELLDRSVIAKSNVVTFLQNASTILHNFYKESTAQISEEENKMSISKAAAAFIKNDIRSMPVNKQCYPSTETIQSAGDYVFLPQYIH